MLKTIHVKGDLIPLRVCVDKYITEGANELRARLDADDFVRYWELGEEDA